MPEKPYKTIGKQARFVLVKTGTLFTVPQKAFLIFGLIFGLFMLIANPPFMAMDENVHFAKAYSISEGHILPVVKKGPGDYSKEKAVGYVVPKSLMSLLNRTKFWPPRPKKDAGDIISAFDISLQSNVRVFKDYSIWAINMYSPLSYLPQAYGITIGRILGFSPLLIFYLGRFFNLLVFLALVFSAIVVTPVHKWVFFLIGLLPVTINLAASLSSDAMTIGLSLLAIAFFLRLALDDTKLVIEKKDKYLLFLLAAALALAKPPYFLLIFLFFIIPMRKFKSRKEYLAFFTLLLACIIIIAGFWSLLVADSYTARLPTVSPGKQVRFALDHPASFVKAVAKTIYQSWQVWLGTFIGGLGWFNVSMPIWFVYLYLFVIIWVAALDKSNQNIDRKQKAWMLLILIAVFLAVFTQSYFTWTPVGATLITGFQPRYLIPICPLFFLLFYNLEVRYTKSWFFYLLISFFVVFSSTFTMYKIIVTLY